MRSNDALVLLEQIGTLVPPASHNQLTLRKRKRNSRAVVHSRLAFDDVFLTQSRESGTSTHLDCSSAEASDSRPGNVRSIARCTSPSSPPTSCSSHPTAAAARLRQPDTKSAIIWRWSKLRRCTAAASSPRTSACATRCRERARARERDRERGGEPQSNNYSRA